MTGSLRYRADIDGLRAIAVLSVVGFHAFPDKVSGGFLGVDVFFVISGYLITALLLTKLESGTFSFASFYARRIRRIFPALLLVLAACLLYGWNALLPGDYQQLGKHSAGAAGFIANFMFMREVGYFDVPAATKPLLHVWSLSIEEQFYIVFPALVCCAYKRRLPMGWLLAALMVLSLAFQCMTDNIHADTLFFSPVMRAWELLAGALLAHLLPKIQVRKDNSLSVLGVGCILLAVCTFTRASVFPGWRGMVPVLGTVLLIAAGSQALINRTLLSFRPVVWVGLVSYPLYLWHWPLLAFARLQSGLTPPVGLRLELVGLSLLLAWATYALVERGVRYGGHSNTKAQILCLLMAAMGGTGYCIYSHNGFPDRFPPFIQDITGADFDYRAHWGRTGCFYRFSEQDSSAWPPQCTDASQRPAVVLWGDSHAAMLYYGLEQLARQHPLSISQYTSVLCPPFLGYDNAAKPYCRRFNGIAIHDIERIKPDYVMLSARWDLYDVNGLQDTVSALKRLRVPHIVMIGPNPLWQDSLARLLLTAWQQDPQHRIPAPYMTFGLKPGNARMDQKMQELAGRLGIDYLSVYKKFCNAQGCLTRLGDKANQITTYDDQHLSPPASGFFMDSVAGYFFPPPKR